MPKVALLIVYACLLSCNVFAQGRGIELQAGAGYVFDPGEGPSVLELMAGRRLRGPVALLAFVPR